MYLASTLLNLVEGFTTPVSPTAHHYGFDEGPSHSSQSDPAALRWEAGTRLIVENTPKGVLLKPAPLFAETRPEEVFGCLARDDAPKSLTDMEAGILAEARRRYAGD